MDRVKGWMMTVNWLGTFGGTAPNPTYVRVVASVGIEVVVDGIELVGGGPTGTDVVVVVGDGAVTRTVAGSFVSQATMANVSTRPATKSWRVAVMALPKRSSQGRRPE